MLVDHLFSLHAFHEASITEHAKILKSKIRFWIENQFLSFPDPRSCDELRAWFSSGNENGVEKPGDDLSVQNYTLTEERLGKITDKQGQF